MDELVAFLQARLNEREALLLHTQASGTPCPIPISTLLAEVQAKRRILDEYEDYASDDDPDWERSQYAVTSASALELAIKILAQPYAGQPGWRDEWQLSAPA